MQFSQELSLKKQTLGPLKLFGCTTIPLEQEKIKIKNVFYELFKALVANSSINLLG